MTVFEQQLNEFFQDIFNDILILENQSLSNGKFYNLSVNEMHVISAVCDCDKKGENTMKKLSEKLKITAGSLTISVKTLEQKGYLIRLKDNDDKRKVFVFPTELGKQANNHHEQFHNNLVTHILSAVSESEISVLIPALSALHRFFTTLI